MIATPVIIILGVAIIAIIVGLTYLAYAVFDCQARIAASECYIDARDRIRVAQIQELKNQMAAKEVTQ